MTETQTILIGLERIHPGRWQPRDRAQITDESLAELAADIKARGLLNPLLGAPVKGSDPVEVELVAGERRWRAAGLAGLSSVPVRLVEGDEAALQEMAIVDNLQREDLTVLEEAEALKRLQDLHGYSQRQLAGHLNKSQPWVQQRLALLEAAPKIQEMVNTRVFSLAHARALSGLPEAVQEAAATHLDKEAARGVSITSRQVDSIGSRIRQFLHPDRFAGVEQERMHPERRNGLIALRHELQTQPEARISAVIAVLLKAKPGSEEARLLGRQVLQSDDILSLVNLVRDPAHWRGVGYGGVPAWTDDVARATGRTCTECIFGDRERPDPYPSGMRVWCLRWGDPGTPPVSCAHCILPTDDVAIPVSRWNFADVEDVPLHEEGNEHYILSIDDYLHAVEMAGQVTAVKQVEQGQKQDDAHRIRLEAFRARCEAAWCNEDGLLDVDHFQAQWCARCALANVSESDESEHPCELIERPIGSAWEHRPALAAWLLVERELDNEEKPYLVAARVVPRCEMFRWAVLPALAPVGWLTFSRDKAERKGTAIRWLHAMITGSPPTYGSLAGIWSPLRWLPYNRKRDKHYDLERLCSYVLQNWDELGDGAIGALLNAAASEAEELRRDRQSSSHGVYNPCTGEDEEWIVINWEALPEDGSRPGGLGDQVHWPGGD